MPSSNYALAKLRFERGLAAMSHASSAYEGLYEACTDCFHDLDPACDLPPDISARFRKLMQGVGFRGGENVPADVAATLRSLDDVTVHSLIEEFQSLAKILETHDRDSTVN